LPEKSRDEEEEYPLRDPVMRDLERLKWSLWHGNVYKALQVVQSVKMDLDAAVATSGHGATRKLLKAIEEFHTYIDNNAGFLPNYGERYRYGERISTGFVELTVNQVISKRLLQAAAKAVDQTRDAPALANAGQDPQRRTGCRIQALVSRSAAGGGALGSLTPRVLMLSLAGGGVDITRII
jgi:hypothetical protein